MAPWSRIGRAGRAPLFVLVAVLLVLVAIPTGVLLSRHAHPAVGGRTPAPPPRPLNGMLWGMWIKDADGMADPSSVIAARESAVGHRLDVFHWYESWDASWTKVGRGVDTIDSSRRIPMITWEADGRSLSRIAQGGYDSYIDTWARGAADKKPHEIWLRVFHEFNDPGFGAGYSWNIGENSPQDLTAAWRHIHDRFAAAGADNVKWIWNPDGVNQERIASGYPGDAYVDYTGWDTYGYDNPAVYQNITRIAHKPMVIGEFGVADNGDVSGLQDFTKQVASGSYPLIHAVVYFDEGRSAVGSNPSTRNALQRMLASPGFR